MGSFNIVFSILIPGKVLVNKITVAMGIECSPKIHDITLVKCEKETSSPTKVNYLIIRYEDIVPILFNGYENHVRELVNTLNSLHPTLKITAKFKLSSISYSTKENISR